MSEFSVVRTSSYTELNVATLSAVNATITNATITNATITNATIDLLTIDLTILNDLTVDGVIKASDGTVGAPSYTFTSDIDTGMYRPANNTIGLSTGNMQTATFAGSVPPANMIQGLNIGTTTDISGIRRVSSLGPNSWEDGYLGNSEAIYFTPTDFVQGANGTFAGLQSAVSKLIPIDPLPGRTSVVHTDNPAGWGSDMYPSTFFGPMQRIQANIINGPDLNTVVSMNTVANPTYTADYVVGQPVVPRPYVGMTTNSNSVLVAQKIIPKGFRIGQVAVGPPAFAADTCTIFSQTTFSLSSLFVWSQTIASPSVVMQLHNQTPYNMNSISNNFTVGTAVGDGTTLVTIVIDLGVALTNLSGLLGAKITMQRI